MALLAVALVIISAILSCGYKISIQSRLTNVWKRKITKAHAVAIESIQLCMLLSAIVVQYFQLAALLRDEAFLCFGLLVPSWIAIPVTLAIYIFALFAIDLIDNKIQLGVWRHPIQIQTLLLTRSWLLPSTVKRRRRHHKTISSQVDSRQANEPTRRPDQANSPTPLNLARRYRSLSEPTTPRTLLNDTLLQRRGSLPEPGSVARLVSTFEQEIPPSRHSTELSDCGSMTTWPGSIGDSEPSPSLPTPSSTSEKASLSFDDPFDLQMTDSNDKSNMIAIAEMPRIEDVFGADISTGLPTPDSTPEKALISLVPPVANHSPEPTTKEKPERPKKTAARHTAERAQRRKQKGDP